MSDMNKLYSSIEAQNLVNFYNQSVFAEDLNPSHNQKGQGNSANKGSNISSNRYHNNSQLTKSHGNGLGVAQHASGH